MLINAVNEKPIKSKDEINPDRKGINDNQFMPGKNNCEIIFFLSNFEIIYDVEVLCNAV